MDHKSLSTVVYFYTYLANSGEAFCIPLLDEIDTKSLMLELCNYNYDYVNVTLQFITIINQHYNITTIQIDNFKC